MTTRIQFQESDYRGRVYRDFIARRGGLDGPGWHVYGRCLATMGEHTYGGGVVMHCAWPDKPARRWPGWSARRFAGWRTKREAADIARRLNEAFPRDSVALPVAPFARAFEV